MRLLIFAIVFTIMLPGCQQSVSNNTESSTVEFVNLSPPVDVQSGYPPYPEPNIENAYPSNKIYPENVVTSTPQPNIDPSLPIPTPKPGTAILTGYVISEETTLPVPNLSVSLAKVFRNEQGDGAFALEGASSPTTLTDGNGRFILRDIEPVDYVIVLGNVEVNRYEIITAPSGEAKIWSIIANQITDIDNLTSNLE